MSVIDPVLVGLSLLLLFLIAVADARTGQVPDALSIPFVAVAFLHAAWGWHVVAALQGAVIGGGFFVILWGLSRGKWVGSADIIVGAGIGCLLTNPPLVVMALAVSYILGAAYATVLLLTKRATRKSRIPFIPFLAAGAVIGLFLERR